MCYVILITVSTLIDCISSQTHFSKILLCRFL
nr:MAG TPA: hypothetical protein [Bacteriophage sp.]